MISGIAPILFTPFDEYGGLDAPSLRRLTRYEVSGGLHAIGINGFASEAYKLSDAEQLEAAGIVAEELAGALPLIIGIAPKSLHHAIEQAQQMAQLGPAAFMVLPPATMDNGAGAIVEFYVALSQACPTPLIVQQAPHIPMYHHTELSAAQLAEVAQRARSVRYFKLEGPGSSAKMRALVPLLPGGVQIFGGGGGISALEELHAGAAGLIPGVGYNEIFLAAWSAWQAGDRSGCARILRRAQALIQAVSAPGHEHSLHLRKQLMLRYGIIGSAHVRAPTVRLREQVLSRFFALVEGLQLRIAAPGTADATAP